MRELSNLSEHLKIIFPIHLRTHRPMVNFRIGFNAHPRLLEALG